MMLYIHHINGDRNDNRVENLRVVSSPSPRPMKDVTPPQKALPAPEKEG